VRLTPEGDSGMALTRAAFDGQPASVSA